MSGLEPLAIFGIACNVMQTISFAHESITTLRQIHKDGTIDPNLRMVGENMRTMADDLASRIKSPSCEDVELLRTAKECSEIAKKLVDELDNLVVGTKPGKHKVMKTLQLGAKKWLNKRTIEKLEKDLSQAQKTMESRILIRVCTKNDAIALKQSDDFAKINEGLQSFIAARSMGETKLEELMKVQTVFVKLHVSSEHEKTREQMKENHENTKMELSQEVSSRVKDLQVTILAKDERAKLLNSFDFPRRNERICDIKDVKGNSFNWLFGDMALTEGADDAVDFSGADDDEDDVDFSDVEDEIYEEILEKCQKETWDSFTDWLKSDGNLYWIIAKAGAGKSTLMKFLFEDSRTKELLTSKRQRPALIVAHSFYLIGSQMQCDIKGLLCNLISQILKADEEGIWIQEMIQEQPRVFNGQVSCTDWPSGKLQVVLHELLEIVTRSREVCFFLDGLDEIHKVDGKHALLQMLKTLRTDFSLKMCVSSRPEAEFTQALSSERAPNLELSKLTAGDMYRHALKLLTSGSDDELDQDRDQNLYTLSKKRELAESVIYKADGVFLWADIAIRDLQTAITNGDTWEEVEKRLSIMPEELNTLFASMWDRIGNNKKVYAAEAALCFNLALEWVFDSLTTYYSCRNPEHEEECNFDFCDMKLDRHGITLFQLVLAKRDCFSEFVEPWKPAWKVGTLSEDLLNLYKRLPILSAGLLEFTHPLWYTNREGQQVADPDVGVRFIHRSAREFFTESVDGQNILRFDHSRSELRFCASLRAVLWRGVTFQLVSSNTTPFHVPIVLVDTHILTHIFYNRASVLKIDIRLREMSSCQAFHEYVAGTKYYGGIPDFLAIAAAVGDVKYLEYLSQDPRSYTAEFKIHVLVNGIYNMITPWGIKDWYERFRTVNYLLSWGYVSDHTIRSYGNFLCITTGHEAFVRLLVEDGFLKSVESNEQLCDALVETLQHFAECGADFMQPAWCFYVNGLPFLYYRDASWHLVSLKRENTLEMPTCMILAECPLLGILIQIVKTTHRKGLSEGKDIDKKFYLYPRVEEFLTKLNPDWESIIPNIIATGNLRYGGGLSEWADRAKRVPVEKASLIAEAISKWAFGDKENLHVSDAGFEWGEEFEKTIDCTIKSILDDDTIPAGITDCLLDERGIANTRPHALLDLFRDIYETLPEGTVFPPVKYIANPALSDSKEVER